MRKCTRRRIIAIVTAAASTVALVGCAGGREEECEKVLRAAIESVDRVTSVEVDCSVSFEGSSQSGEVGLDADSQKSASPIIEEIYRAFAAESEIDDAWIPRIIFTSQAGDKEFEDDFQGDQPVYKLRDHYDIHPSGAD